MTRDLLEKLSQGLVNAWYRRAGWLVLLYPISWIFGFLVRQRIKSYQSGSRQSWKPAVPMIVVGNIALGGTGKTPLVIALAEKLQARGYKPGIVSRGVGSQGARYPYEVTGKSHPSMGGDEPVLMARRLGCPVVIDPDRVAAARYLLNNHDCDVLISDDGLQHYALGRDIEIVVVDGERGFGNAWCLPAGPLRESMSRLDEVDFVVVNGNLATPYFGQQYSMTLLGGDISPLSAMVGDHDLLPEQSSASYAESAEGQFAPRTFKPSTLSGRNSVHAVAGIGHPQRFFNTLEKLGYDVVEHEYQDHYNYQPGDLDFESALPIIMTEKDAVKCAHLNIQNAGYLPVKAMLSDAFWARLFEKLKLPPS